MTHQHLRLNLFYSFKRNTLNNQQRRTAKHHARNNTAKRHREYSDKRQEQCADQYNAV